METHLPIADAMGTPERPVPVYVNGKGPFHVSERDARLISAIIRTGALWNERDGHYTTITLRAITPKKEIHAIKAIRAITGKMLRDAKEIMDVVKVRPVKISVRTNELAAAERELREAHISFHVETIIDQIAKLGHEEESL